MNRRVLEWVIVGMGAGLFACGPVKKSPVLPETCDTQVDFAPCIQPIFDVHCVGCHGGNGGLSLEAGQAEQNLVNVPSTCDPGMMRVKPGFPEQSLLYLKITDDPARCGSRMPPTGETLSTREVNLIRQWIEGLSP